MNKLDRLIEAIQWFEGWKPGSRSYRNNNPGNLRYSKFQASVDGSGYAVFDRYHDGLRALAFDILCKSTNKTRTSLTPESTIYELFDVFAPYRDNNSPKHYAQSACARAKLEPSMQLKELANENS